MQEKECSFGDKCKFNHDVKKFLEGKLPDLGSVCYLYETYGKCPSGITCRYAKSHLTEDMKNMLKPDADKLKKKTDTVSNVLPKDLQHSLWKRKYDFSKTDAVLEKICPLANHQKNRTQKYLNNKQGGGNNVCAGQHGNEASSNTTDAKTDSIEDSGEKEIGTVIDKKGSDGQDGSLTENKGMVSVPDAASGIQIVDSKLDEPPALKKKVID